MTASSHRSFSSLSSPVQVLVIRLLQEELQPFLHLPDTITPAAWAEAIQAADPTLCCHYTDICTIKLCPESRPQLLERVQQELMLAV